MKQTLPRVSIICAFQGGGRIRLGGDDDALVMGWKLGRLWIFGTTQDLIQISQHGAESAVLLLTCVGLVIPLTIRAYL